MLRLTGKNVVVIGGSRGVGRRIVEGATREGARFVPPTGPRLFPAFGLPLTLAEAAGVASPSAPRHS